RELTVGRNKAGPEAHIGSVACFADSQSGSRIFTLGGHPVPNECNELGRFFGAAQGEGRISMILPVALCLRNAPASCQHVSLGKVLPKMSTSKTPFSICSRACWSESEVTTSKP